MADNKIRIDVAFNSQKAEQNAKNLSKALDEVKSTMEQTAKTDLNIDTKTAEKGVKSLSSVFEKLKDKLKSTISVNVDSEKIKSDLNAAKEYVAETFSYIKNDIQKTIDVAKDPTKYQIDTSEAEKRLDKLDKEIEKLKKKKSELFQSDAAQELTQKYQKNEADYRQNLANAKTPQQKQAVENAHILDVQDLKNQYSGFLSQVEETETKLKAANGEVKELVTAIRQSEDAEQRLNSGLGQFTQKCETAKNSSNGLVRAFRTMTLPLQGVGVAFSTLSNKIGAVKNKVKQAVTSTRAFQAVSKAASRVWNGLHTAANRLKTAISKVRSAFQKVSSLGSKFGVNLKSSLSPAESLKKKFTRVGLALLGARSAMMLFKQVVSSAMENNEKLQTQLNAAKGVLGEAISPLINALVSMLSKAVTFADAIYQAFTGTSLVAKYNAKQAEKTASATEDAAKAAKEYKNQMASFDVANKLSDNSSSSSSSGGSSSGEGGAIFETSSLDSWMNQIIEKFKAGDWGSIGRTIAGTINSALDDINWSGIQTKVKTFCKDLSDAVNGFIDELDWGKVGNNVGEAINTVTMGINTLVDNIDWNGLGAGFADGMNHLVDTVDTDELGKTLSAKIKIITDTLYGFFNGDEKKGTSGFDFKNFGGKIGDTVNSWFNNIDWGKIASNMSDSISGAFKTVTGFIKNLDTDAIIDDIVDFVKNIDWEGIADSAFEALGAAVGKVFKIAEKLGELFNDAFKNITSYFDDSIDEAGGNVIEGIFNGIVNWLKDVGNWMKEHILDPFINGFKEAFDIHSPSKNQDIIDLGKNLIEGAFNGIVEWLKDIKKWFQDNVFSKITEAWDGLKELTVSIGGNVLPTFDDLKDKWDSIKEKGKTAMATIKGEIHNKFKNLKTKWDSIKNKTNWKTIKGSVHNKFKNLKSKWDSIKNKTNWKTVKGSIAKSFSNAKKSWDGIKSKAETVTTKLKDGITNAIKKILTSLCNMVNKVIGVLNKILPRGMKISTVSPPKLARGGIVNNPGRGVTATVGEAGAEAILPLENNTGWMDLLAERIANRINANGEVLQTIITLDGETIAKKISQVNGRRNIRMNGGVV